MMCCFEPLHFEFCCVGECVSPDILAVYVYYGGEMLNVGYLMYTYVRWHFILCFFSKTMGLYNYSRCF